MEKLSVVIITFNEEKNIEKCLMSVKSIADEILVIDSLSTDATPEICKRHNVHFVSQKWLGYSEQKNYANELAENNYILSIDADEVVSDELAKSINEEKAKGFPSKAYDFNRLTFFCGHPIKHCGWYPDYRVRMWRRDLAQWKGKIHELLKFDTPTPITRLKGDLLHYSFHSIEQHEAQVNKFSTISAQAKFEKGKTTTMLNVWFAPKWKFFKAYVLQLGFLDGKYGYVVCKNSSHAVFLKYMKLYQMTLESKK